MPRRVVALRNLYCALAVCLALPATAAAIPIANLPNLVSVTIWESTGAPLPFTFSSAGPQLTTRLPDPLSVANSDFLGTGTEFYDVFYSDASGNFDPVGTHVTVTAIFDVPGQSGGNVSEVQLDFAGGTPVFADVVTAFVTQGAIGVEAFPNVVGRAADGDLQTTTFLGQTQGATGRLSVTVGFPAIPEPGTASLVLMGLLLLSWAEGSRR